MSSPFVAEVRIFPFNFPPTGWAFCDGQLLLISQNTALFSLLGTTYGGDGKSTFALPNMQGNAPMQQGQGAGLSLHDLGETAGSETVTLLESEIPSHSHGFQASNADASDDSPAGKALAVTDRLNIYTAVSPSSTMSDNSLTSAGGDLPHNNMQPYLTLNFCIAMQGIFPPRG